MVGYLVRRLLWSVALLFAVSATTFLIFYALPSADPAAIRAGRQPTPELLAQIRHNLGLDEPIHVQYWHYMRDLVLHFDLGFSYQHDAPVRELIFDRLPATLSLTAGAVVVALALAVPVGVVSALWRRRRPDRALTAVSLVALSAPPFWLGLVALYLFSDDLGLVPLLPGANAYRPLTDDPGAWLGALVMPWLVLAAAFAAFYARLLRASLSDALSEDYVRTARAKGVRERNVVVGHGLRAAITPVVTVVGLDVGILLGGAVLVESVFNVPGIGRLAYDAVRQADLPVIQGTVLLGAFFIVVANLAVDLVYRLIDPRVRPA